MKISDKSFFNANPNELINWELSIGNFIWACIKAKESNKQSCREYKLAEGTTGFNMTPQEELYAKFFSETRIQVAAMDDIALAAFREELAAIAFQARASLTAADSEINEREKKRGKKFEYINSNEDISSEAINKIKDRTKKLTKLEKIKKTLMDMGVSEAEAEVMIAARNVRDSRGQESQVIFTSGSPLKFPGSSDSKPLTFNSNPPVSKTPPKKGELDWDAIAKEALEKEKAAKEAKPITGLNLKFGG